MPTVNEVLDRVNTMMVTAVPEEQTCRWLSELDGQLARESLGQETFAPYRWPADGGATLLVPAPWDGVYDLLLRARIHDVQGESAEYNNCMAAFNNALQEALRHYRRTHCPPEGSGYIL